MNANQAPSVAVEPGRLSPTVLRCMFVLAAAAAIFFLATATAKADDSNGAVQGSEQSSKGSGPAQSDVPDKSSDPLNMQATPEDGPSPSETEPKDQAEEPAAPHEPTSAPAEPAVDAPVEEAQKPSELKVETPSEATDSPAAQGKSAPQAISETVSNASQEIEAATAPTLEEVEKTTRQLSSDLSPAIGEESQVVKTLRDLEGTVREVTISVDETLRPVETTVRELGNSLNGSTATPEAKPATKVEHDRGAAVLATPRVERKTKSASSKATRTAPVVRVDKLATQTEPAHQVSASDAETHTYKSSGDAPSDGLTGPGSLSVSGSNGGGSGGASSVPATFGSAFTLAIERVGTASCDDVDCPRSVGCQPGVAPD